MIKNRKYHIAILLLFFNLVIAQNHKLGVSIQKNPTDTNYWWLENNNFGIEPSDIDFQVHWQLKTLKTESMITIIGQDTSEKFYVNESFIKYNFSELFWLNPVAAWINIISLFLMFCIILWVIDQYQGGIGLPIQENIDVLSEELKHRLLMVSHYYVIPLDYESYYLADGTWSDSVGRPSKS